MDLLWSKSWKYWRKKLCISCRVFLSVQPIGITYDFWWIGNKFVISFVIYYAFIVLAVQCYYPFLLFLSMLFSYLLGNFHERIKHKWYLYEVGYLWRLWVLGGQCVAITWFTTFLRKNMDFLWILIYHISRWSCCLNFSQSHP